MDPQLRQFKKTTQACERTVRQIRKDIDACRTLLERGVPDNYQDRKNLLDALQAAVNTCADGITKLTIQNEKADDAVLDLDNNATNEQKNKVEEFHTYEHDAQEQLRVMEVQIFNLKSLTRQTQPVQQDQQHDREGENRVIHITNGNPQANVKLPKLELLQFSGDKFQWKPFWNIFESSVHSNPTLHPVEKLSYLLTLLHGEPQRLVSSLPLTNENYNIAVETLKEHYDNTKALVSSIHSKMMNMKPPTGETSKLREFYVEVESSLKQLEVLQQNVVDDQWITLILSKLPRVVAFTLERSKGNNTEWTLDSLRKALRDELQIREAVESTNTNTYKKEEHRDRFPMNTDKRTTSDMMTASEKQHQRRFNCAFCDGQHYADECPKFKTVDERKGALTRQRRCYRCLKTGHGARTCSKTKPCFNCKNNHESSLCPKKFGHNTSNDDRRYESRDHTQVAGTGNSNKNRQQRENANIIAENAASNEKNMDNHVRGPEDTKVLRDSSFLASGENGVLQTVLAEVAKPGSPYKTTTRIFLDNGSSRSYMTTQLAQALKLKLVEGKELHVNRFMGGENTITIKSKTAKVDIIMNDHRMVVNVSVIDSIAAHITRVPVPTKTIQEKCKGLKLADTLPSTFEQRPIEFLIGTDYYMDITGPEKIQIQEGLYLLSSPFGWILGGRVPDERAMPTSYKNDTNLFVQVIPDDIDTYVDPDEHQHHDMKNELSLLWQLESIGITDSPYQNDDDQVVDHFEKSVKFKDGRYYVKWPLKSYASQLPDNYGLAVGRLKNLLRRLQTRPELYQKICTIFKEQLATGIIEKVQHKQINHGSQIHYLSHHPVEKPQRTTTKVRQVYDASASQGSQPSLNDVLYRGQVILESLPGLLIRFRLHPVALISDIEKAFLQIGLQDEDRDLTRFLWLKDENKMTVNDNIQTYRFCRVPFGTKSSPFLLGVTIRHHLKQYNTDTAHKIRDNTYVDNVITGANNVEEAKLFYKEAKQMFTEANMNLREWLSNSTEVMNHIDPDNRCKDKISKVLGVKWDSTTDTLQFKLVTKTMQQLFTKRDITRFIYQDFDPLGYFCPLTIRLRIILQELTKTKWDEPVSERVQQKWVEVCNSLDSTKQIEIPRCVGNTQDAKVTICCFVDASARVYGAAVYLRIDHKQSGHITSHLIFAKNRLCPLKKVTIPRLELLAALIGTRAIKFVRNQLRLTTPLPAVLWSDSQCVLHWIRSKKELATFVENRIREINTTNDLEFRYVPSSDNPADIATRGASTDELKNLWWKGPTWLVQDPSTWPTFLEPQLTTEAEHAIAEEHKKGQQDDLAAVSLDVLPRPPYSIDISRFSSITKLWRTTAFVQRAINCFKGVNNTKGLGSILTTEEVRKAKAMWDKYTQSRHYYNIIHQLKSPQKMKRSAIIDQLGLQLDRTDIIRCHGRLSNATIPEDTKYPVLLPKLADYTKLLIRECHERLLHSGTAQTLADVRSMYWIPSGRIAVRSVIQKCNGCRRFTTQPYALPHMPNLPECRVTRQRPFQNIGLDYFGPFYVRMTKDDVRQKKVWVCLYTCLAVRAIHTEIVLDMSAEAFIEAMRRFFAKHGKPTSIICDNAPSFKLGSQVIATVLQRFVTTEAITWKFIPEYTPWAGGVYERMVGILKSSLLRAIGRAKLSYDQFKTVLAEAQCVANNRPLTYVSEDLTTILKPSHFTGENQQPVLANFDDQKQNDDDYQPDVCQRSTLVAHWKKTQHLLEQFWKLWEKEYITTLRERTRWFHRNPKSAKYDSPMKDEVVLIYDPLRGRTNWLLGRVEEVTISRDGCVRSVILRLPSGRTTVRPVNHIYSLEVPVSQSKPHEKTDKELNSSAQRQPIHNATSQPTTIYPEQDAEKNKRPQRKEAAKAQRAIKRQLQEMEQSKDDYL